MLFIFLLNLTFEKLIFYYYMRYTKIKNKKFRNKKTQKLRNTYIKRGGDIQANDVFKNINSIGFEIESNEIVKFTIINENEKYILINSSLVNADIELGFTTDEFIYIVNEPEETFKITNDVSNETNKFNKELKKIYKNIPVEDEDEDDCDTVVFKLNVPKNRYLKQNEYDIQFKDSDFEATSAYKNCMEFSHTEYIATYFNPIKSNDIIKTYLFKTIQILNSHLKNLVMINGYLYIKNSSGEFEAYENLLNIIYYLPNTNLLYLNSSTRISNKNYKITDDLSFVPQMTFSCNIVNIYNIMINLHNLDWIKYQKYTKEIRQFYDKYKDNVNFRNMLFSIKNYKDEKNKDIFDIQKSYEITQEIVNSSILKNYIKNEYDLEIIKSYLFLIIYKIYIYLNVYIENKSLMKYYLVFAVRHNNYILFNEIKNLIKKALPKSSDNEIIEIISSLLNENILNKLYYTEFIKSKREEEHDFAEDENYGDPYYSIKNYFDFFDEHNEDWFIDSGIDEGSTKFDLIDNNIIVEFRSFPEYLYIEIFFTGDDIVKEMVIQKQVGSFKLKTINLYFSELYKS